MIIFGKSDDVENFCEGNSPLFGQFDDKEKLSTKLGTISKLFCIKKRSYRLTILTVLMVPQSL